MSLSGLIAIDKPGGITSRRVVDKVQRLARPAKVGHAGTLDPLATGVLVVCVGAATRLISFVQEQRKTYIATFLLGKCSDTEDVTGNVVETPGAAPVEQAQIRTLFPQFIGRIQQLPPKFSAVHVAGRRAYDLARRGEDVELTPREIEVHRIELLSYAWPELRLEIECGSGTYIRSIGRDLGEALGCGAVMSALVRTRIGQFALNDAVDFEALDEAGLRAKLVPPLAAVTYLRQHICSTEEVLHLRQGKSIASPVAELESTSDMRFACVDEAGSLIAVAEFQRETGRLHPAVVLPLPSE